MGLRRGGPCSRTQTMELSVSSETGLRIKTPTQKAAPLGRSYEEVESRQKTIREQTEQVGR